MAIATIIFFVLTALTLVYLWIQKRYTFFARNGIPHDKPSFPLGNVHGKLHPAEIFKGFYDKFRGKTKVCGVYMFINPVFLVTDLDLARDIMIRDFEVFHNRGAYFNKKTDPLSAHLLTIEDQEWKDLRTKLTPTFTGAKMRMYFNILIDVSNHMLEKLKSSNDLNMVEVKDVLAQYTTDVIGNVAFGLELNTIDDPKSDFRRLGQKLFAPESKFVQKAALYLTFKSIVKKLGLKLIPEDVSAFFMGIVRDTVNYRLQNNIQRNDVLDTLLKIGEDTGERLTMEEIAAQCFIFFMAGFETSSSTGTFVLFNLVRNPEIQEKLRDEIKAVLSRHENQITYDAIKEMKYLQMVIDESLRMFPPAAIVVRQSARDYNIDGTELTIPKGTTVMIPIFGIHHDPNYYPEPEKFDPERFNEENKAKRHPMAFMPFGHGPRNCIGFRFGLMQTKIALIKILLNFQVMSTEQTPKTIKFESKSGILSFESKVFLKFKKMEN